MFARLGQVLYIAASAIALLIVAMTSYDFIFATTVNARSPRAILAALALGGLIWLVGAAVRFVLGGTARLTGIQR